MAKYKLDESRIPGEKAKVKCSRCQHIFHVYVSKEFPSHQEPSMQLSHEQGLEKSIQAPFQCPQCGFEQPHSQECIKCGIIFSKYKPRAEMPPPPYSHTAGGYGLEENFINDQAEVSSMTYAGFWARFAACFIDGIIVMIPFLIMFPISYQFLRNPQMGVCASSFPIGLFLICVLLGHLYFIFMWGSRGATLGKMAMGIRIVRTDGFDISYGTAFLRYIGYSVISPNLLCLGFLWMLWDNKKQTWHDKISSTCVIQT
jgi:predicted Zn finger-like uncharacterized protein